AHLKAHGFGDIEVNVTGGYDPTSTPASARLTQAQVAVLKRAGIDPVLWPRNAGSYPGYVFTGEPLKLASGHFGLGHGSGAHAPDEYYVIESTNPVVRGWDAAVRSFVDFRHGARASVRPRARRRQHLRQGSALRRPRAARPGHARAGGDPAARDRG